MKYLALTVDVEPDSRWPTWTYADPLTFDGVSIGVNERFGPLCARLGLRPTYLINNIVLEHRPSVETLARQTNCELGTHLHPEFIGPDKKHSDYSGKTNGANQCFLPEKIEFEKLSSLTALFRGSFGRQPLSFRAGRFSAQAGTVRSLIKLGYKIDSSVTPHIVWDDPTREKPVDFRSAPEQPYFVSANDITKTDPASPLLEVPLTIIRKWRFLSLRTYWFRPGYSTPAQLMKIADSPPEQGQDCVLNMMFHNVELVPGKSPYNSTEEECRSYLDAIESAARHCLNNGFKSATLSEIHDALRR